MGTLEDPLACKFMWDGEGVETHICCLPAGLHAFHMCICRATEQRNTFDTLFLKFITWTYEVMPDCSPEDFVTKFKEESREFLDAETVEERLEETVDSMLILLAYGVRKHGADAFLDAIHDKLVKNKTRTWVRQADGTYHHV